MDKILKDENEFSCLVELPIVIGVERRRLAVIAVFRCLSKPDLDEWVMPGGVPRSDHELATEVLCELRCAGGHGGRSWPRSFCIATVLEVDDAAALLVSTFLSQSPRSFSRASQVPPPTWSRAAGTPAQRRSSELARCRDGRAAAHYPLQ